MKKNILIVGHKGYIGRVLTNYLLQKLKKKLKIIGIDSNFFSLNKYSNINTKIKSINYDCRKIKLKEIKPIPETIVYLAAVSNDPMGKRFKTATEDINFKNCIKLAKQAKKLNVKKFIFASSCSMYGSSGSSIKKKETDKLQPLTDYAKSKVNSEKKLRQISSKKFKIISLRFATAAGMSDNLRLDLVFNDFIANATLKKEIELLSSGSSWRPLIHVQDMAKAFHWAIEYKLKKNFIAINIGSEKWNFKIIDLAKKIANIIGGVSIKVNKNNIDKRSYRVDFRLFKKIAPAYQPSVKFKTAVKQLELFFKKEKNTLKDFRNSPKWSRLKRLNHLIKNRKINKKLYWI